MSGFEQVTMSAWYNRPNGSTIGGSMSERQNPLEALSKYFDIKLVNQQHELRCKVCRSGWAVSVEQAATFNPLGLFDHAFMHQDAGKPQDECIE
jgi:hypothetical protein